MAGTITALVIQRYNKQRVSVHLDGSFAFGLALDAAIRLHKGQYLSDADIAVLCERDHAASAYERALNYLSYRPRSAEEVRRNLFKHAVPDAVIDETLARLERAGLVDDVAFAQYWVESRQRFRPRSPRALRYELRQKGLDDSAINAALAEADAEALAYDAARRYQRRMAADIDPATFHRKLSNHLARLGFAYSLIRAVVSHLLAERETHEAG